MLLLLQAKISLTGWGIYLIIGAQLRHSPFTRNRRTWKEVSYF